MALLALLAGFAGAASKDGRAGAATAVQGRDDAVRRLETRYATLLFEHRPDLAARYALPGRAVRFAPLDEATINAHLRGLRALLASADSIGRTVAQRPEASARVDTLRARIRSELDESAPGGALRRDALLWLDIVAAAVTAPFSLGPAAGCDRTHRATLQLLAVPEALRGAAVLMRGASPPDPATFEARLASIEALLRHDLPSRTDVCKEGRRLAEFAEADTLAAASLAEFRRTLAPGD